MAVQGLVLVELHRGGGGVAAVTARLIQPGIWVLGHLLHPGADERDELPAQEEPEVAVAEGAEAVEQRVAFL